MIFTYREYLESIHNELDGQPTSVSISTFNFHVGISETGGVYKSETHRLIDQINSTTLNSRILIGITPNVLLNSTKRLIYSAEFWRNIKFRTLSNCHLKCWIFSRRSGQIRALVGGRNLGDSEWSDLSVWLRPQDSRILLRYFDSLWARGASVETTPKLKLLTPKTSRG